MSTRREQEGERINGFELTGRSILGGIAWAIWISCLFAANRSALGQVIDCKAEFYPGQVIVRFQPGTTAAARGSVHAAVGALRVLKEFDKFAGLQLVEVTPGQEKNVVAAYRKQAGVKYAEPDYLLHLAAESTAQLWGMHNAGQTIQCGDQCSNYPHVDPHPTSDPGTSNADINAMDAWGIWEGDEQMLIGVVDTGIEYWHDDLRDNMWANSGEDLNHNGRVDGTYQCPTPNGDFNCYDDDQNGCVDDVVGCNFWYNPPNGNVKDTDAYGGHGTHVAGTIAARSGNGIGIVGVNWKAKLVSLPIFDATQTCAIQSLAIEAVQYAIRMNIRVTNHSYGGPDQCQGLCDVFDEARTQIQGGHIAVAAAGNYPDFYWHDNDTRAFFPASCPQENVIAVAAVDNDFNVPAFSHYGASSVDVAAPGDNIYSTLKNNQYGFKYGTSMATPHVTGVVALVWSRFDDWDWLQVKNRIHDTVRPAWSLHQNGPTPVAWGGVVDAYRAIKWDCGGVCSNPLCMGTPPACTDIGPDCNKNCILDECDIASGESCDQDGNLIPDECNACCRGGEFCENRLAEHCIDPTDVFYEGVTCDDCTCGVGHCCSGDTCCEWVTGCECVLGRGTSRSDVFSCQPDPCVTGACCSASGCTVGLKSACGGVWYPGANCAGIPDVCQKNKGDSCPRGTIDVSAVIQSAPPNGVVDARYPHLPNLPNDPSARRGIGNPSGPSIDQIKIKLVDHPAITYAPECWCLCETAPDPLLGCNSIQAVSYLGQGIYQLTLHHPITAGETTTIGYVHSNEFMRYISHPANVNGDTASASADILDLIDFLNGVKTLPWGIYSCDIDRSALCAPADILAEIDLLNGASGFRVWNGTPKPPIAPCPMAAGCPSGQSACGGSGLEAMAIGAPTGDLSTEAAAVAASGNDYFADWFVKYVTTTVPQNAAAEADFRLIVDALTKWCVAHFSEEERGALANRLSSAVTVATSPVGSELAAAAAGSIAP
jgi:subtilisin family serine protease